MKTLTLLKLRWLSILALLVLNIVTTAIYRREIQSWRTVSHDLVQQNMMLKNLAMRQNQSITDAMRLLAQREAAPIGTNQHQFDAK
jgi:hypothetical protein